MTKVLNLDDLETNLDKVVTIKGVDYAMKALSVEDFINQMKEIDAMTTESMTAIQMYEVSLTVILRAFPGLEEDVLRSLNTFQIDSLYAFLKDKAEDIVEDGADAVGSSEGNALGEASS